MLQHPLTKSCKCYNICSIMHFTLVWLRNYKLLQYFLKQIDAQNSALYHVDDTDDLKLKQPLKIVIVFHNIPFYCIFDQTNRGLVDIAGFFPKHQKGDVLNIHVNGNIVNRFNAFCFSQTQQTGRLTLSNFQVAFAMFSLPTCIIEVAARIKPANVLSQWFRESGCYINHLVNVTIGGFVVNYEFIRSHYLSV